MYQIGLNANKELGHGDRSTLSVPEKSVVFLFYSRIFRIVYEKFAQSGYRSEHQRLAYSRAYSIVVLGALWIALLRRASKSGLKEVYKTMNTFTHK